MARRQVCPHLTPRLYAAIAKQHPATDITRQVLSTERISLLSLLKEVNRKAVEAVTNAVIEFLKSFA